MSGLTAMLLTLDDLKAGLRIEIDFQGWGRAGISNSLTVNLFYGEDLLDSASTYVDPVGYKREDYD